MAPDPGPLQRLYIKQAAFREAIIVNHCSKIKETKRTRKSQSITIPGVDNPQKTKLQDLNRTATTVAVVSKK